MKTTAPRPTAVQLAEARVIAAAERSGVDWRDIALALKLRKSTYYRRRGLPADLKARRDAEDELAHPGAARR